MRFRSFQSLHPYSLAVTPCGRYYTASEHRIVLDVVRNHFPYHMVPILISSDEVKKRLKGYKPNKAELFHKESAKIADKDFETALRNSKDKNVILMSGGSASGKTEFLSLYLKDFDGVIFDSTLPTVEGAKIKFEKIKKAKKIPIIYVVFPDDLRRAFTAFLHRDRKFSDEHFYRTHANSRKTLLWLAENYPDIEIKIFESRYLKKSMRFYEYIFDKREYMVEFLKNSQYTEQDIVNIIKNL